MLAKINKTSIYIKFDLLIIYQLIFISSIKIILPYQIFLLIERGYTAHSH